MGEAFCRLVWPCLQHQSDGVACARASLADSQEDLRIVASEAMGFLKEVC